MTLIKEITVQLSKVAKKVRTIEAEAMAALYGHNNKVRYHELMSQKARILFDLPECIAGLTTSLDSKLAQALKSQIGAFSFSAGKALDLNSVFYMSALLYPDDYTDGDTNDLENFIVQLESSC